MLSKPQISYVKSLHQKKFRKQYGQFIVEGLKSITEFMQADYMLIQLFHVPEMASKVAIFPQKIKLNCIDGRELNKISTLTNPQGILAIFQIPEERRLSQDQLKTKFSLVLDAVQDPGNLGTIIRTADWFGIEHLICSPDTADIYNPKVIQATMGSLAHISVHYQVLELWLPTSGMKVYGALLEGKSIYECGFDVNHGGLLLLGNEGHGIRPELLPYIDHKITIPHFGSAESLNVAIAAAIICAEVRRGNNI